MQTNSNSNSDLTFSFADVPKDDTSIRTAFVWKNNPIVGSSWKVKPQLKGIHVYEIKQERDV